MLEILRKRKKKKTQQKVQNNLHSKICLCECIPETTTPENIPHSLDSLRKIILALKLRGLQSTGAVQIMLNAFQIHQLQGHINRIPQHVSWPVKEQHAFILTAGI